MNPILKMMTGTFCSHSLGFLRDIIFFSVLGSSLETSAFLIAFLIPNLFRRLCGEGALTTAFIPVFSQRLQQQPQTAHHFLSCFFSRFGVALGSFCIGFAIILAIGHHYFTDEKTNLVLRLTILMLPFLWFVCTAALYNGALNVCNSFFLTAFSSTFLNLAFLCGLGTCSILHLYPILSTMVLSVCVVMGGWFQWWLPKKQLQQKGFRPTFQWENDPDVTRVWKLFLPSVIGAILFQINNNLGQFLSYIVDAPQTGYLCLAGRFIRLPFALFSISIFSVLFPQLSLAFSQKNHREAKLLLQHSLRLSMLLLLPSAIGLFVFAQPFLSLCFQWGKFSWLDIRYTTPLMKWYALQLPFSGIIALLNRVFYSHQDVQTPVRNTAWTLLVHLLSCCCLIPFFGVLGIPMGTLLSSVFQLGLQMVELRKHFPEISINRKTFTSFPWIGFGIYSFLLWIFYKNTSWNHTEKLSTFLLLSGVMVLTIIGYIGMLWVCDREGLQLLRQMQIGKPQKTSQA